MSRRRRPISYRVRFQILQRDGFRCRYCGQGAPEVVLHIDHFFPVATGGGDGSENLITSCSACNVGKAAIENGPVGRLPDWLEYAADACFTCPPDCGAGCYLTLPVFSISVTLKEAWLAYRCAHGHQWRCWWEPELARTHAANVREGEPTFPADPRWLS